jgi:predicted HTH transcriptional regulator
MLFAEIIVNNLFHRTFISRKNLKIKTYDNFTK